MEIKNLTPHPLNFVVSGETRTIPPSGAPVRCSEKVIRGGETLNGIPLIQKVMGDLEGLPPATPGVALVVSLAAAQKAWSMGRRDVLAIGESVRDADGRIIGASSLSTSPQGFSFMDEWGNLVTEEGDGIDGD